MEYFRSHFAETIFNNKYKHEGCETWPALVRTLAYEVCESFMPNGDIEQLAQYMEEMKFIPAGRYLYYSNRKVRAWNNCFLTRSEEDTREDWANLSWKVESCLSYGGGVGNDYSVYREAGRALSRTGGVASGPVSKMRMINEIGREVMQGGSRRSALFASLNHKHADIQRFLHAKNWGAKIPGTDVSFAQVKQLDFNFPCPLDMTNISVNYDTDWLLGYRASSDPGQVFMENCKLALATGEPGFSFNFFDQENETLRNACTEVTSEDDSDVCNLGSVNLGRISSLQEMEDVTRLASQFLLCGTLRADLKNLFVSSRSISDLDRLFYSESHRFFAVNMFACIQSIYGHF